MRGEFVFGLDEHGSPVTWLHFDGTEATELQMAGADEGNPSVRRARIFFRSSGARGAAWRVYGLDPTFGRLDGSLESDTGPWTDLAAGLADDGDAGDERILWVRSVAHRWEGGPFDDANPRMNAQLRYGLVGAAAIESGEGSEGGADLRHYITLGFF